MPEKKELGIASTPRHLWVVGIVALLWNAMGALDFVMTQTKNEAYMGEFTPEQLDFFYGFPLWLVVFWAVAVWGGVIGAVVLLLKNRLADHNIPQLCPLQRNGNHGCFRRRLHGSNFRDRVGTVSLRSLDASTGCTKVESPSVWVGDRLPLNTNGRLPPRDTATRNHMDPKNLLFIISDQHNRDALGCYGHPFVQTPNLDALAERGTRFTAAYTTCRFAGHRPLCASDRSLG